MALDGALIYAFFLVFVRCSAMLLSSPVFGAMNSPLQIRVFTTLAISAALTMALRPELGPPPKDLYLFVMAIANEAVAGLLLGAFFSMVLHAATIAGSFIDLSMGLSMSQALNPVTGVSVTVISQFKYMLCLIVFLSLNAHHVLLGAFAQSYQFMPTVTMSMLPAIKASLLDVIGHICLLALQMAAPVAAVTLVVDAALGIVNKAVPQMQAFVVGMPAKILMGMLALSIALPALVNGVQTGVEISTSALMRAAGHR